MAVPSSGELRLYADIGVELNVAQSDVSLRSMSDSAGFTSPDSMSEFYGYVDAIAPSVTTNAISNVGETTLRANGNVTSDGGGTITERGFYIGTNSASPTNNAKYTVSGTTGSYLVNVTGLSDNTTFYVWAFATNVAGTTYGSRVQATTIQTFVPTTRTLTNLRGDGSLNDEYGNLGTSSYLYRIYYINPITNSYVQTYSITVNSPSLNIPSLFNSWPTNAVNVYQISYQWQTVGSALGIGVRGGTRGYNSDAFFTNVSHSFYNVDTPVTGPISYSTPPASSRSIDLDAFADYHQFSYVQYQVLFNVA